MQTAETDITWSAYGRPLMKLAREIGRHLATMHRWRDPGVLDANGIRRRLRMTKVGGRWYVTDEDLRGFFDSLSNGSIEVRSDDHNRATSAHQEQIGRKLDALGI